MSQIFYQSKQWENQTFLRVFACLNMLFALAMLAAWAYVGNYVADPAATASGASLSGTGKPQPLEYPYVILWGGPVLATFMAWCAYNARLFKLARHVCVMPSVLFTLAFLWHRYANDFGIY